MLDQLLSTLQQQAAPKLMSQFGLDEKQAGGSISAAAASVKEVLGGNDGFGIDDALNLFSSAKNTPAANAILGSIGAYAETGINGPAAE